MVGVARSGLSGLIQRAIEQFNGREGETATLFLRCPLNLNGLLFGFAPRHLSRWASFVFPMKFIYKNSCFSILLYIVLTISVSVIVQAQNNKSADVQFGALTCESEMAQLDDIENKLRSDPKLNAYFIVYGGKRDTKRNEIQVRGSRMRRYLVDPRRIAAERITVVAGGFREKFTVEVWFVAQGETNPKPTPTVQEKSVRFKKGLMPLGEEPGPGCISDRNYPVKLVKGNE